MNTTSKQAINATVLILSLSSPSIVNAIDLQGSWTGSRSCTCWEMSFAQPETFKLKDDVIIEVNVPAITPPQFFASAGGDIVYTLSIGESNKSPGTGEGVLISCDIKRPGNTELGIGEFGHVEYDVANSVNDTMDVLTIRGNNPSEGPVCECKWRLSRIDDIPDRIVDTCP